MIQIITGNLFASHAQTLVNSVNCVGVMGKGLALEFKRRFPDMYVDYVTRCEKKQVKLGRPYLFRRDQPPWILNFPTKDHWRSVSRLEDIVEGLKYLRQHYREWGITSLAVPALGCSHGQLDWSMVEPTLTRFLRDLDISVELYAPRRTLQKTLQGELSFTGSSPVREREQFPAQQFSPYQIQPAWVALVEILRRIKKQPYHWPVGRIAFQKIAYFATQLGLPTGLTYERGSYGPFASDLKDITVRLVNNNLIYEEQQGNKFAVEEGSAYLDARNRFHREIKTWESIIERVTDLFLRINTSSQAEIAATVHFVTENLRQHQPEKPTESEVLEGVMRWKQKRRPPLNETAVAEVIRNLAVLGWIDVRHSSDLPVSDEMAMISVS